MHYGNSYEGTFQHTYIHISSKFCVPQIVKSGSFLTVIQNRKDCFTDTVHVSFLEHCTAAHLIMAIITQAEIHLLKLHLYISTLGWINIKSVNH